MAIKQVSLWLRASDAGGNIGEWEIVQYCFNFNYYHLEAVQSCECSTQDLLQCRHSHPNQPLPETSKPYGAHLGINFHWMPFLERVSARSGEEKSSYSSLAAERYVEALSNNTSHGRDFLLLNRQNAWRKHSNVRSLTISRCTDLDAAQVNRQI